MLAGLNLRVSVIKAHTYVFGDPGKPASNGKPPSALIPAHSSSSANYKGPVNHSPGPSNARPAIGYILFMAGLPFMPPNEKHTCESRL